MEALVKEIVGRVASVVEGIAALFIAFGALECVYMLLAGPFRKHVDTNAFRWSALGQKKWVWLQFARWLVLALEFELAADILRISISPTWNDIGQVGAIAVIRTFLNYFLEKDAKEMMEVKRERETRNTQAPPAQA
jgi:uncharacterized membrane protein